MKYPEILAWELLWYETKEEVARLMYGAIKAIRPEVQVGWHVYHRGTTWDAIFRAAMDYGEMVHYSDWIKPVVYHDIAGPRIQRDLGNLRQTVLQELSDAQSLALLYALMGLDPQQEPGFEQMSQQGLSADYVYRETRRCVQAVQGRAAVYAGVGFDIPWNGQRFYSDPALTYQATYRAFEAGASGLVVSREYDEMRLDNLRAVKRAVQDASCRRIVTRIMIPFYIGSYTERGSTGIYLSALDTQRQRLAPARAVAEIENPTWLALHPTQQILYAASTVDEYEGRATGSVAAYAMNPQDHTLRLLNRQDSQGKRPCYLTVDARGHCLLVANFGSGTAAVLPIRGDGSLDPASDVQQAEGSSVHPVRQLSPHVHCVLLDPNNRFVMAADLGSDQVWTYWLDSDSCRLLPTAQRALRLPAGTGPRHIVLDPAARRAYLISELDNTVHTLAYDPEAGTLTHISSQKALPEDFSSAGGDIHLSPDGQYLYASNRGHESLVVFRRENGQIQRVAHEPVHGASPRHFAMDPSGTFLIVANQGSDNVVLFRRDLPSGRLTFLHELSVPSPACIRLLAP